MPCKHLNDLTCMLRLRCESQILHYLTTYSLYYIPPKHLSSPCKDPTRVLLLRIPPTVPRVRMLTLPHMKTSPSKLWNDRAPVMLKGYTELLWALFFGLEVQGWVSIGPYDALSAQFDAVIPAEKLRLCKAAVLRRAYLQAHTIRLSCGIRA